MKSILIPTDFSDTSYHTISYGIALAKALSTEKIVIYNAYQPYVPEDPEYNPVSLSDLELYKEIGEQGMQKIKDVFQGGMPSSIELICEVDYNVVESGIIEVSEKYNAGLIIMNVSSTGALENLLFGSTAVSLSRHSKIPVLIVPAEAKFTKLDKMLLAIDLKNTKTISPIPHIRQLLDITHAQLDALHVLVHEKDTEEVREEDIEFLKTNFAGYKTQYFVEKAHTLTDGINDFADEHQSDMIIMIPKKRGWLESIFRRSESKAIVFHSHVPVLAIRE
ncbi:universal stress protein [Parafilimonas sp.]|uniref:universal stress protein n=1 Tax=Parafilimonas sp. TaxID=1969739 RepID=UPI0039E2A68E